MELAVDIGNSSIKAGLFHENRLLEVIRFKNLNHRRLVLFAISRAVTNIIVASVRNNNPFNNQRYRNFFKHVIELGESTSLPVKNLYKTPKTLGKDRLAGVVGANAIFPGTNVLVVDMGSAITYDLINSKKEYLGGNISPGMSMRYKALHSFTKQLPLLRPEEKLVQIGRETNEAIHSGVQNGIIFETERYIESLNNQYAGLKTILTGGDAKFFDNKLKYTIFVESNLILIGLHRILKYNIYES